MEAIRSMAEGARRGEGSHPRRGPHIVIVDLPERILWGETLSTDPVEVRHELLDGSSFDTFTSEVIQMLQRLSKPKVLVPVLARAGPPELVIPCSNPDGPLL